MQVREILRVKGTALFTITENQALTEALAALAEYDIGSLVVMGGGKMVGMLTFREMLLAVHQRGGNIDGVLVRDVMVRDPVSADPDMEANDLRRLLIERRVRYLPVMEEGTLLGVISFLDVAKAVLEEQGFENRMLKNYIKNWPSETDDDSSK